MALILHGFRYNVYVRIARIAPCCADAYDCILRQGHAAPVFTQASAKMPIRPRDPRSRLASASSVPVAGVTIPTSW